ncbi:queuine tRNA-ribosyltransferase [Rhodoligotrophos appendicifer]|uniref:tRNA guanosine(34) transglycosylase Tgt n=1 Tax=Rhodoligotrophos appendicifer TaxID=987056 RepID=UPI0011860102|nr:tRNA guanosine(34) transglycosylase Tgt [Rhodoligotrophos appendicifer]
MALKEDAFTFRLLGKDADARTGLIDTPRGAVRTPAFMPVGTAGTVKALYPDQVDGSGADILLGNTYHLMLRPGAERLARLGGLHQFMRWQKPILTDSGGFQVMSLASLRKITEEGVAFQSHIDGSRYMLTPERSIQIQGLIGSDIQMVLDECVSWPCSEAQADASMQLSLRWAERSKAAFGTQAGRALFGIVQGSTFRGLRESSARGLIDIGFDGYAIGGLAVGEGQAHMLATLEYTAPLLPENKPRYLMGVGTPHDLLEAISIGIDMFDCVMPTRAGRHGKAYTRRGPVNLRNARHAEDHRPLDEESACPAAFAYSRAYLHHLFKAEELLGQMLLSWANTAYYQNLMQQARQAIAHQRYEEFRAETKSVWARGDITPL